MDFKINVRDVRKRPERKNRGGTYMEEKLTKKTKRIIEMIAALRPEEFIGVCKILGVQIFEGLEKIEDIPKNETKEENQKRNKQVRPRDAADLISDVIDKVNMLNRTQKRNLETLLKAATKKEKKKWH